MSSVVAVLIECDESVGIEEMLSSMVVVATDPRLMCSVEPPCPGASGVVTEEGRKLAFLVVVRT